MRTLGIIGFGRFGQAFAGLLKGKVEVCAYDVADKRTDAKRVGVYIKPLADVATCDAVVLSVPISEFETTVRSIIPHITEGSLVMDTCSVKEFPVRIMQRDLPRTAAVLGTHPLFGPDSIGAASKLSIALCPVRGARNDEVTTLFREAGMQPVIIDATQHDRAIAQTLNLPHLIGRALAKLELPQQQLSTLNYSHLMEVMRTAENDTKQLFYDMHAYNPYAKDVEERFVSELRILLEELA